MHRVELVLAVGRDRDRGFLGLDATGPLGRGDDNFLEYGLAEVLPVGSAERQHGREGRGGEYLPGPVCNLHDRVSVKMGAPNATLT